MQGGQTRLFIPKFDEPASTLSRNVPLKHWIDNLHSLSRTLPSMTEVKSKVANNTTDFEYILCSNPGILVHCATQHTYWVEVFIEIFK